jgi:hypothetical protein
MKNCIPQQVLWALLIAAPAFGQVVEEVVRATAAPARITSGEDRIVAGAAIPRFVLVNNFFVMASSASRSPSQWTGLLSDLGMDEVPAARDALAKATEQAKEILHRPLVPPGTSEYDFAAAQKRVQEENARDLGRIWYQLRSDLQKSGYALGPVESFLELEVRPSTHLVITEELFGEADEELARLQDLNRLFLKAAQEAPR